MSEKKKYTKIKGITFVALLAALALTGCKKEEGTLCLKVQPMATFHQASDTTWIDGGEVPLW